MDRLILMLVILFLIGFFYSFVVQKFSSSKIINLIPSILGVIWIIYSLVTIDPNNKAGLADLGIIVLDMLKAAIIVGNIAGFIFFNLRKK